MITIVSVYVLIIQILKLVYLIFEPRFLSSKMFGPPKTKIMLAAYYLLAIIFLLLLILDGLGVISFQVEEVKNIVLPTVKITTWIIFIFGGILIGAMANLLSKKKSD
ncbi:MAG: hypothetical protein M3Y85_03015 [Bacteroidota bacterium]|nr:hypothetical protein [Bacteroidota bacterium]